MLFRVVYYSALVVFLGLACSAQPLQARQSNDTPFSLYAYGDNINGLPVFNADGAAQIGNMSLSNAANKVPMYVTYSDNNTAIWVAHANTTQVTDAAFQTFNTNSSTTLLSLSKSNGSTSPVNFVATDADTKVQSSQVMDAWSLYGKYVLLSRANANFYAQPIAADGCYSLLWSETLTSSLDHIPITLRTVGPSTG